MNAITMLLGLAPIPARPAAAPVRRGIARPKTPLNLLDLPRCDSTNERIIRIHRERADVLQYLWSVERPARSVEIAVALGLSDRSIADRTQELRQLGKIRLVRTGKCGAWEIVEPEDEE